MHAFAEHVFSQQLRYDYAHFEYALYEQVHACYTCGMPKHLPTQHYSYPCGFVYAALAYRMRNTTTHARTFCFRVVSTAQAEIPQRSNSTCSPAPLMRVPQISSMLRCLQSGRGTRITSHAIRLDRLASCPPTAVTREINDSHFRVCILNSEREKIQCVSYMQTGERFCSRCA